MCAALPECESRSTNMNSFINAPGDRRLELPEVDLGLLGRAVGLPDRNLAAVRPELDLELADQPPHAGLRHINSFLLQ